MADEADDGMALIMAANPVQKVEEPETEKPVTEEPLELTDEVEEEEASEDEQEAANDDEEEESKKGRSKPADKRIADLTAKLREAERREAAANERLKALQTGEKKEAEAPVKPNPDDFEYGESDPAYIDKLTDYKLELRDHERSKKDAENNEQQAMIQRFETGIAKAEIAAQAKYEDFDQKITEAVANRGGEPLPPLLTVGVSVSPVGGDILYRLATDEAVSTRMENLAKQGGRGANALAMELGKLEGEYLDNDDDGDLDMSDPMDMARMMGRMRARLNRPVKEDKPTVRTTQAPEPPKQRARGSSGKFEVDGTTTDFLAFEKQANKR